MSERPLPKWSKGVREQIYDHVYGSPEGEVGGVLVGDITESGPINITGAIAALRAEGERASVTFTHDAWSEVHEALETKHPGKRIVGWYHSHPGFGIFLSEHDLFIQRNFFSDPAQVAYVVDPHASTEGLFGWVGGDIEQVAFGETPRPPRRAALPPGMEPSRVRSRESQPVGAIAAFALAGIVVGAVLWFAVLRPEPSPSTTLPATTSTDTSATTPATTTTSTTNTASTPTESTPMATTTPSTSSATPAATSTPASAATTTTAPTKAG